MTKVKAWVRRHHKTVAAAIGAAGALACPHLAAYAAPCNLVVHLLHLAIGGQ